jgi:hypothetical protein
MSGNLHFKASGFLRNSLADQDSLGRLPDAIRLRLLGRVHMHLPMSNVGFKPAAAWAYNGGS